MKNEKQIEKDLRREEVRCKKLAEKVLQEALKGKREVRLNPILGGLAWRFSRETENEHYLHVQQHLLENAFTSEVDTTRTMESGSEAMIPRHDILITGRQDTETR
jgi:hypothetical protein